MATADGKMQPWNKELQSAAPFRWQSCIRARRSWDRRLWELQGGLLADLFFAGTDVNFRFKRLPEFLVVQFVFCWNRS